MHSPERIRLDKSVVNEIKAAFRESFLTGDHLWIFGSRVDLSKRGGDIDLYVESTLKSANQVIIAKLKFLSKLYSIIGEQKIDVVIKFDDADMPIYKIAKEEGIKLI